MINLGNLFKLFLFYLNLGNPFDFFGKSKNRNRNKALKNSNKNKNIHSRVIYINTFHLIVKKGIVNFDTNF